MNSIENTCLKFIKRKQIEANKGRVAWNKGIKSTRQKDPITGRFLKTNKQL